MCASPDRVSVQRSSSPAMRYRNRKVSSLTNVIAAKPMCSERCDQGTEIPALKFMLWPPNTADVSSTGASCGRGGKPAAESGDEKCLCWYQARHSHPDRPRIRCRWRRPKSVRPCGRSAGRHVHRIHPLPRRSRTRSSRVSRFPRSSTCRNSTRPCARSGANSDPGHRLRSDERPPAAPCKQPTRSRLWPPPNGRRRCAEVRYWS